jgi:hypothetical protein
MFEKLQSIKPDKWLVKQAFYRQLIRIKMFLTLLYLINLVSDEKHKKARRLTARLEKKTVTEVILKG